MNLLILIHSNLIYNSFSYDLNSEDFNQSIIKNKNMAQFFQSPDGINNKPFMNLNRNPNEFFGSGNKIPTTSFQSKIFSSANIKHLDEKIDNPQHQNPNFPNRKFSSNININNNNFNNYDSEAVIQNYNYYMLQNKKASNYINNIPNTRENYLVPNMSINNQINKNMALKNNYKEIHSNVQDNNKHIYYGDYNNNNKIPHYYDDFCGTNVQSTYSNYKYDGIQPSNHNSSNLNNFYHKRGEVEFLPSMEDIYSPNAGTNNYKNYNIKSQIINSPVNQINLHEKPFTNKTNHNRQKNNKNKISSFGNSYKNPHPIPSQNFINVNINNNITKNVNNNNPPNNFPFKTNQMNEDFLYDNPNNCNYNPRKMSSSSHVYQDEYSNAVTNNKISAVPNATNKNIKNKVQPQIIDTDKSYEDNLNLNQTSTNKKNHKFHKLNVKFEDMSDHELACSALYFAKDQTGCRFLQKKIEQNHEFANDILFPAISNDLLEFMTDSFGNYLIQKLIEIIDETKLEIIIKFIHPHFFDLGLNPHGTRVIQNVIECIKLDKNLYYLNKIFEPHIVELMKDANGNHIIIKYVNTIKFPKNQFLYKVIADNIIELATNKHACCAFQKCLNNGNELQVKTLIERIVENTYILMSDPYGNYLLQFVLSMNDYEANHNITTYFKNKIGYLSRQKFSSNVIEKCFDHCDQNSINEMVSEICNPKLIVDLLLDMFGNYGMIFFKRQYSIAKSSFTIRRTSALCFY